MNDYKKLLVVFFCILCLQACQKPLPKVSPTDTLKAYVESIKQQDGLAMAKYSESGKGDDFTISEADANTLGLNIETAKSFYSYILNFDYTVSNEQIIEETATADLHIVTYDIMKVLNASIDKNVDTFGEINGSDESEMEKSRQIANILLKEFENANKDITEKVTFHFVIKDGEWKVKDAELPSFYQKLLNTSLE